VHNHRVTLAHKGQEGVELWSSAILARRFVGEHPIDFNVLKLAFWILVEATDANISNTLTVQGLLLTVKCQNRIYNP
jgi:hypothetical protein